MKLAAVNVQKRSLLTSHERSGALRNRVSEAADGGFVCPKSESLAALHLVFDSVQCRGHVRGSAERLNRCFIKIIADMVRTDLHEAVHRPRHLCDAEHLWIVRRVWFNQKDPAESEILVMLRRDWNGELCIICSVSLLGNGDGCCLRKPAEAFACVTCEDLKRFCCVQNLRNHNLHHLG